MSNNAYDLRSGYVVIIEWDGQTPPTVWYNRLHDYGLWVRGSKDKSPLLRRETSKGVVFQEGAVVVESQSFAHLLAAHAVEMGAKAVSVGMMNVEQYKMSEEDVKVFTRITKQKSKRGPKTQEDEGWYAVTCFEEALTHEVELREKPTVCPICGGFQILWHKGKKHAPVGSEGTVERTWLTSRFFSGHFEIVGLSPSAKPPQLSTSVTMEKGPVEAAYKVIPLVSGFKETIRAMDVAYCIALNAGDEKARLNRRIMTLREYYLRGGERNYPMAVPDDIDLVDLAGVDPVFIKFL